VTSRYASQYEDKKREEWKLDNVDNFTAGDLKEVLSDAVILVKPCLMALPSAFRQQLNLLFVGIFAAALTCCGISG